MQKAIRILAIIATILCALSLLLIVLTTPFQDFVGQIFGYPQDSLGALPQFPLVTFVFCFLRTVLVGLLIICCGNKKGGIWLELLILGLLILVLPAMNNLAASMYSSMMSSLMGDYSFLSYTLAEKLAGYCVSLSGWGSALAYVACGMSIALKRLSKKAIAQ